MVIGMHRAVTLGICPECGKPVYLGEDYTVFGGEIHHPRCIQAEIDRLIEEDECPSQSTPPPKRGNS